MKRFLAIALLAASLIHAQTLPTVPGTPQRIIIDTDIGSDLDDAQAVAIALRLRQLGYFNIRALTSSTWLDKAPAFLNLLLAHGGLTTADIPIGANQALRPAFTGGGCYDQDNADNYMNSTLNATGVVPNVGRVNFPAALTVLRAALAGSPDGSVIIVTLGGFTNISALLQSAANAGGDGFASGQSLWDTKVVRMVSQLSGYPPTPFTQSPYTAAGPSFNMSCDSVAAKYAFEHNGSIPIIGAPLTVSMELGGCYDGTGAGCTSAMPATSPTRIATGYYRAAGGAFRLGSGNMGRQYAWDPSAVFYSLVGTTNPGGGAYFSLSSAGTLSIVATNPSSQTWSTASSANHYFAINTSNWTGEQSAMTTLLMDDYQAAATPVHPRLLLNDTLPDTWDAVSYPGGTLGRLAAVAARSTGGNSAATTDFTTLRALVPTGGTPTRFSAADEQGLDGVMAYGLAYQIYHRNGDDTTANPYALALYNGLKSGTSYGPTYPVYSATQIVVASNTATVTLTSAAGVELAVGASVGVWGCALANDSFCGSHQITAVSGSTFSYAVTAGATTITDAGMVVTRSYLGADQSGQIGVSLAEWAYLYDWCYTWVAANGHAAEVVNYIKAAYWSSTLTRTSSSFDTIRDADYHNYSVWLESAILEAGIVLNGDDTLGVSMLTEGLGYFYNGISVRPASLVNSTYTYKLKASIDFMTEGSMNWEGSQYSRNAVPRILRAIEAYEAYTGRSNDLWNTQFSTAQNFGFYRIYVRDPNGTMANFGESTNLRIFTGKDNIGLSMINDRFPDSHLVWMMTTGVNNWNDGNDQAALVYKLMFYPYVNGPGSHDPTDLPLSRRFGTDVVIRSGWGANDTMLTFTGSLKGVYHRKADAGSFTLYRGGYLVAAPNYTSVEYPVYDGWLKRTIASNAITIYDPSDCVMDNIATCGINSYGQLLTNDGGQRNTLRRLNPPFSVSEFELSRSWSGSLFTDPTFSAAYNEFDNVTFPTLTSGTSYDRVSLDMTKAYTNAYNGSGHNVHAKTPLTSGVVRDMIHFQPVSGSIDPVIIFDKAVSTNAAFPKAWTIHTIGAPQVTPSWTTAPAGITSASTSVMRVDNGTARMYMQTLLPASPTVRAVGGNSCSPKVITNATNANPAVFTIPGHGLNLGERVGIDVGTYSATSSTGYNAFGSHPAWLLDDYDSHELTVASVLDADHVIFSIGSTPWDTSSLPTFTSTFSNVGAGAPSIAGFLNKMYYQTDAAGGNSAWNYTGSSWTHIGVNGNGLTAPTMYKHTDCDYSYYVDQFGAAGATGKNLWVFPQDVQPTAGKPEWRAEVRPSAAATTDYFLNVLTPTTTSNTTGPTTTIVTANGWYGAQVSDGIATFVAMFQRSSGATGVAYTATHTGAGRHVVTGLAASTSYPVLQGVSSLGSVTSDSSGALAFSETGGGTFSIGVVPLDGAAVLRGRTTLRRGAVSR